MPVVIVKNVDVTPIFLESLGISIGVYSGPGDEVDLTDQFPFERLVEAEDLETRVTNSEIVINDGVQDLSAADGVKHLSFESVYMDEGDAVFPDVVLTETLDLIFTESLDLVTI